MCEQKGPGRASQARFRLVRQHVLCALFLLPQVCAQVGLGSRYHLGSMRTRDTSWRWRRRTPSPWWIMKSPCQSQTAYLLLPLHEINMTPDLFKPLGFFRRRVGDGSLLLAAIQLLSCAEYKVCTWRFLCHSTARDPSLCFTKLKYLKCKILWQDHINVSRSKYSLFPLLP